MPPRSLRTCTHEGYISLCLPASWPQSRQLNGPSSRVYGLSVTRYIYRARPPRSCFRLHLSVSAMACSLCRLPFTPSSLSNSPRWPPPDVLSQEQLRYMKYATAIGPYIPGLVADLVFMGRLENACRTLLPPLMSAHSFVAQTPTASWGITPSSSPTSLGSSTGGRSAFRSPQSFFQPLTFSPVRRDAPSLRDALPAPRRAPG